MFGYCQKDGKTVDSDGECAICSRHGAEPCEHWTEFDHSAWHDTSVEKPKDGEQVLIWIDGLVSTATYNTGAFYDCIKEFNYDEKEISAWMKMLSQPDFGSKQ